MRRYISGTGHVNLARLATLGLRSTPSGWEVQPA